MVRICRRSPGQTSDQSDEQACKEHETARPAAPQPRPVDLSPGYGDRPDNESEQPEHHPGTAETVAEGADQDREHQSAPALRAVPGEPSAEGRTTIRLRVPTGWNVQDISPSMMDAQRTIAQTGRFAAHIFPWS